MNSNTNPDDKVGNGGAVAWAVAFLAAACVIATIVAVVYALLNGWAG